MWSLWSNWIRATWSNWNWYRHYHRFKIWHAVSMITGIGLANLTKEICIRHSFAILYLLNGPTSNYGRRWTSTRPERYLWMKTDYQEIKHIEKKLAYIHEHVFFYFFLMYAGLPIWNTLSYKRTDYAVNRCVVFAVFVKCENRKSRNAWKLFRSRNSRYNVPQ